MVLILNDFIETSEFSLLLTTTIFLNVMKINFQEPFGTVSPKPSAIVLKLVFVNDLCVFRKICFILKLGLPVAAVPGALSPLAIPNAAAAAAAAAAGRVGMPGVSVGGNTVLLVSNLNEEVSKIIF